MRKPKKKLSAEAEVNMTPMLDIVFIMLIFFIVSSSFVRESGLDLTQHRPDENDKMEDKVAQVVVIRICANKDVFIDRRAIDIRSIRANIERKLAEDGSAIVVIQSEQNAPTGYLVMALNQAHEAKAGISVSSAAVSCRHET